MNDETNSAAVGQPDLRALLAEFGALQRYWTTVEYDLSPMPAGKQTLYPSFGWFKANDVKTIVAKLAAVLVVKDTR